MFVNCENMKMCARRMPEHLLLHNGIADLLGQGSNKAKLAGMESTEDDMRARLPREERAQEH